MDWFRNWINQVVLSVIICVIIELILPDNTNKKYVKTIIGIYMLFSIISPLAKVIDSNYLENIQIFPKTEKYDLAKEVNSSLGQSSIEKIYTNNIKESILNSIQEMGYYIKKVEIEIDNNEEYKIKNIKIYDIKKIDEDNKRIDINKDDEEKISKTIKDNYGVDNKNIFLKN